MTKGFSFRRNLVAEAILEIKWPDWTEQEVYHGFMPIKVADEHHFEPFRVLHYLLIRMKLVRHYKGKLVVTKMGKTVIEDRFNRFDAVARTLLFDDRQFAEGRWGRNVIGNWDIWLNVLDVETQHGATGKQITEALYGVADNQGNFDPRTSAVYDGVLKPLTWCGLLDENMDMGRKLIQRVYTKTPLWARYLQLDPKKPMLRVVH